MPIIRNQSCSICGEHIGRFAHNERTDGVLSCGSPECSREAARDERDMAAREREEAQESAFQDDYSRYR